MANGRRVLPVTFALLIVLRWSPASSQSPPQPAPVRPVSETLHGVTITDPYRWMESGGQELTAGQFRRV